MKISSTVELAETSTKEEVEKLVSRKVGAPIKRKKEKVTYHNVLVPEAPLFSKVEEEVKKTEVKALLKVWFSEEEMAVLEELKVITCSNDIASAVLKTARERIQREKRAVRTRKVKEDGGRVLRHSRYIPKAVRKEVRQRDGYQCAYVSPDGIRCKERADIQMDHFHVPFSRGGEATADNLRLLCPCHNRFEAEKLMGKEFIQKKIQERRASKKISSTVELK